MRSRINMPQWPTENLIDKRTKYVLFLISPILGFLYALRRINTRSSYVVFFLFALCFGLSFTNNQKTKQEQSIDSDRYLTAFHQYVANPAADTIREDESDYYFDGIALGLSKVTDNYHWMFLIFAGVFAFFQLKSLKYLTQEKEFRNSLGCLLLCFLFTYNGIFNINGVRFWTAAWIAVFCMFKIYRDRNYKYLLLVALTPLIHFSYWIFIGVVVGTLFAKRFEKLWIIAFILSYIYSNIALTFVSENATLFPELFSQKIESYTNENVLEYEARTGTGWWWISDAFKYLCQLYFLITIILFINNRKSILKDPRSKNLYLALLIWMTFSNFTMSIPSVGRRFIILSYPIIAYLQLTTFKCKKYKYVTYALPFVFLFDILIKFPTLYSTILSPLFFVTSPIYMILKNLVLI